MKRDRRGFIMFWAVVVSMMAVMMVTAAGSSFAKFGKRVETLYSDMQRYYYCEAGIYHAKWRIANQSPIETGAVNFDTYFYSGFNPPPDRFNEWITETIVLPVSSGDTYKISSASSANPNVKIDVTIGNKGNIISWSERGS